MKPVSYTHLDVYKRQDNYWGNPPLVVEVGYGFLDLPDAFSFPVTGLFSQGQSQFANEFANCEGSQREVHGLEERRRQRG